MGVSKVEDRWKKGGGNDKAGIAPSQGRIRQNLAWEIFRMAGGLLQFLCKFGKAVNDSLKH